MRIGILQCDHVIDHLQVDHGDYPHMFYQLLVDHITGLELQEYDVIGGEIPQDLNACDGYIITGSRYSVYDDLGWIEPAQELVRELDRQRRPTVGICFGHQLIATALGGLVEKTTEKGWGVGVHSWDVLKNRSWMEPAMDRFSLLVSHQDQVRELPARAEVLATSDFCPIAAYRIDDHLLGIQGHPEFTVGLVEGILEVRLDRIGITQVTEARATLDRPIQGDNIARWMSSFLRSESVTAGSPELAAANE